MNDPKKTGECAYCREFLPLTKDHIPPRNLFPKNRKYKLITVPCCTECHKNTSQDDEFFRDTILLSQNVDNNESAQEQRNGPFDRAINNPKKSKYVRNLDKKVLVACLRTDGGLVLPKQPILPLDHNRLGKVGKRIVKGLYFKELKISVPSGYETGFQIVNSIDEVYKKLRWKPADDRFKCIGEDVFSYAYEKLSEDARSTVWIMSFYESIWAWGWTRPIISNSD